MGRKIEQLVVSGDVSSPELKRSVTDLLRRDFRIIPGAIRLDSHDVLYLLERDADEGAKTDAKIKALTTVAPDEEI